MIPDGIAIRIWLIRGLHVLRIQTKLVLSDWLSKQSDKLSNQPRHVDKEAAADEREIVANVEAVPEGTEEEDGKRAVAPLVDNVAQPVRRLLVPVIE